MSKRALKPASNTSGRPKKYGAYSFLRTGAIPDGKEYLGNMADQAILRMANDLGELKNLSGSQLTILREVRQLLIFKFLVDERLMAEGIFKPGPGPLELQAPLNAFYLSCCNSIIRACGLLGLKKVLLAADDLNGYLKKKYPAVYDPVAVRVKAAVGPGIAIESVKPLSKRARAGRSSIVEASGEVKHESDI